LAQGRYPAEFALLHRALAEVFAHRLVHRHLRYLGSRQRVPWQAALFRGDDKWVRSFAVLPRRAAERYLFLAACTGATAQAGTVPTLHPSASGNQTYFVGGGDRGDP
jgi:hypothetical protein